MGTGDEVGAAVAVEEADKAGLRGGGGDEREGRPGHRRRPHRCHRRLLQLRDLLLPVPEVQAQAQESHEQPTLHSRFPQIGFRYLLSVTGEFVS